MARGEDDLSNTVSEYDSLLILHYPKVVGIAVDSEEDMSDHKPHYWGLLVDDREREYIDSQPVERAIASCYDAMAELTSSLIRFEIREGVQIVKWRSAAAAWMNGFENLPEELQSLRQLWYGTILYLRYLEYETGSEVMNGFSPRIPTGHTSADFRGNTVNEVLEGDVDPRGKIDMIPGRMNPLEAPRTGFKSPPVTDPETEFEEWLRRRPFH